MANGLLKIATCQFAVSSSIKRNSRVIQNYLAQAKRKKVDIVHFSECALSGYVGTDFASFERFDWDLLLEETRKILSLAGKLGVWVVLGSSHRLTGRNKPHNSLYLINPQGKIVGRYDKRFCTSGDLRHYTAGDKFVTCNVNGVKCSLLICFDFRFPELYRELYKQKVRCVFQSFYNARQAGPSVHTDIVRQSMQCRAASNYMWLSMANSSGYYSPYPGCFIQPDGKIVNQLKFNKAGLMVNTVDLGRQFYDPMVGYREMAIKGISNNRTKAIKDNRSINTKCL